jgi:hypothetical protein
MGVAEKVVGRRRGARGQFIRKDIDVGAEAIAGAR